MAYYLQMDGIDDFLRTPQMTIDRIVLEFLYEPNNPPATTAYYLFDARGGTPAGNYMMFISGGTTLTKGSNISSFKLDDVVIPTSVTVSPGIRYKIDASYSPSLSETNGIEFFVNFAFQNTTRTKGKIFRATGYSSGAVVFDYDMSLGNVQDQSGNGKHGVLTGGTWIEDTPTYTDGSNTLNLINVIYKDNQNTLNLVQSIFADKTTGMDLKQVIYKDSINQLNLVQSIYKDIQTKIDLAQEMYNTGSIDLSLILSIRDDIYIYKQVLETIFNVKIDVVSEFAIKRELETSFTIKRNLETNFTI